MPTTRGCASSSTSADSLPLPFTSRRLSIVYLHLVINVSVVRATPLAICRAGFVLMPHWSRPRRLTSRPCHSSCVLRQHRSLWCREAAPAVLSVAHKVPSQCSRDNGSCPAPQTFLHSCSSSSSRSLPLSYCTSGSSREIIRFTPALVLWPTTVTATTRHAHKHRTNYSSSQLLACGGSVCWCLSCAVRFC